MQLRMVVPLVLTLLYAGCAQEARQANTSADHESESTGTDSSGAGLDSGATSGDDPDLAMEAPEDSALPDAETGPDRLDAREDENGPVRKKSPPRKKSASPTTEVEVASTTPHVSVRRDGQTREHRGFSPERVYFATNREPDPAGEHDPDLYFGDERGQLSYGICEVSIPYKRAPGSLPEPSVLRLEFTQDPAVHVVLMEIERLPDAEFWKLLRASVTASPEKQLLLFVHGYCATFRDAARRTAQMAYDLNYQGPSMFFSWPAGSDLEGFEEKINYIKDLRRAEESDEDLIEVLQKISRYSGAEKVHLIAHSMGNFVLTEALKTMADRLNDAAVPVLFDQAVLAAPDINAREFVERSGIRVRPFSRRLTVYASTEDKALWVSKKVNGFEPLGFLNDFSRRGAKEALFDLVDATLLSSGWFDSGHIYYGDMPELLKDLRFVFRGIQARSLQRGLTETPPLFRIVPASGGG